jgi:hypothetical protein
MFKTILILLLTIPLFQASCKRESLEISLVDAYFQYEYVNYAWGFNHSGYTITPGGEVFAFSTSTPWVFAENGVISFESLYKNLNASVKADTLLSKVELDLYKKLAASAKSGKLSDPVSRGADMGAILCKIIVPEENDPLNFREIILTQTGDFEMHNLAPEAATIAAWLIRLKDELF